jgi:hypothetical protein
VENTCFCIALAVAAAISEDKIKPVKAIASPKILIGVGRRASHTVYSPSA